MAYGNFTSNQGTQTPIVVDDVGGGSVMAVQKLDISPSGASGTLWNGGVTGTINSGTINAATATVTGGTLNNLVSGTINAATVILNNGTINVSTATINGGTLQAATVSSLPNLPGGTLNNLASGTINSATVTGNLGTIGTVGLATVVLPNIPGGTINAATATTNQASGTLNVGTVVNNGGTIGVIQNAGTIQGGTINSATVVNNGGSVAITDNTNTANVANIGTGSNGTANQNALLTAGAYLQIIGTATGANQDLLPATDVSNYRSISVGILGTYTGTVTLQGCNDNATWQSVQYLNGNNSAGGPTTTANNLSGSSLLFANFYYRYARIRMTSYTSGTGVATSEIHVYPLNSYNINANAAQSGNWNVGTMGTLGSGTVQINQIPTSHVTNYGTQGTAGGGTTFGTIQGTVGSGTEIILTDWSIVAISGTPTVSLAWATAALPIQGTALIEGGAFPPGGGIAKGVDTANHSGTNGQLIYGITAGTALFKVAYQQVATTV